MKKTLALIALSISLAAFKPVADPEIPADVQCLLDKHGCTACHAMTRQLVGPTWLDIAAKKYSAKHIAKLIANPEPANWPAYPPMAAQNLPKAEMNKIAKWLADLK